MRCGRVSGRIASHPEGMVAKKADIEWAAAELESLHNDLAFPIGAHLPITEGVRERLAAVRARLLDGDTDDAEAADGDTTQVPTVPPASAGGAAAHPETGATTNVPFSKPLSEGDTSSIPGTPGFDPAAQAEVERDAATRQHAAERVDSGGGSSGDAEAAAHGADAGGDGEIVVLREPDVPGISEANRKALAAAGFRTKADITAATDEQLLAVQGIGPKALADLRAATAQA